MKFRLHYFLILLLILFLNSIFVNAEHINLPRDSNGWTIFTPSSDSRIMYVSADGNDATGQVYSSTDFADPFNPSGENAFATYAAAYANTRAGYPDWILFRRGDTFYQIIGSSVRSGRSSTEPFLIGSYGDVADGDIPVLMNNELVALRPSKAFQWLAITGLKFEYYLVQGEKFVPTEDDRGGRGINIEVEDGIGQGLLVEGCYYDHNIPTMQRVGSGTGIFTGITMRKNTFVHGPTQGVFISTATDVIIEDNIFDHNGWHIQNIDGDQNDVTYGQATMRLHGIYMYECSDYTIKNNIFSRSSSMAMKLCAEYENSSNVLVDNNLILDGEIGIGMTSHENEEILFRNYTITNNVITNVGRSRPTNRDLAWYIQFMVAKDSVFRNNYLLHQPTDISGVSGFTSGGASQNITIDNNVIYGLRNSNAFRLVSENYDMNDITISNNKIYNPVSATGIFRYFATPENNWNFVNNMVYADDSVGARHNENDVYIDLDDLPSSTNDNVYADPQFSDSSRGIETYQSSIGEVSTIDAFIEKIRSQSRYNWDNRYTAPIVNAWIKNGFSVDGSNNNCVPNTCGQDDCGIISDGCSGTIDCGSCIICGDGTCNGDETCSNCVSDCGVCIVNDGEINYHVFTDLPLDDYGWTNFKHMITQTDNYSNSRVIFVSSSSGNDATAQVYDISSLDFDEYGMFQTVGEINSYATIAQAYSQLRDGYADIMLLKRGDSWEEHFSGSSIGNWDKSGSSNDARMIFASYGSGNRPTMLIGNSAGIVSYVSNNIIFSGIRIYSHTWETEEADSSFEINGNNLSNILFEDCVFERNNNLVRGVIDMAFRRNIFVEGIVDSEAAKLYAHIGDGLLMEENIFYSPVEQNRHFYFDPDVYGTDGNDHSLKGVEIRRNIFYVSERTGLSIRSGGIIDDNLILQNDILLVGGHGGSSDSIQSSSVINNVFLELTPDDGYQNRGDGETALEIINNNNSVIDNNIWTDSTNMNDYTSAISIQGANEVNVALNIDISNNIIHNWSLDGSEHYAISIEYELENVENVNIFNNEIQMVGGGNYLIIHRSYDSGTKRFEGFNYRNNTYYSSILETKWFVPGGSFDSWVAQSGEIDARSLKINYPDSGRNLKTYNKYLGGSESTEEFMLATLDQSRFNWDTRYTANSVNNYVREGFGKKVIAIDYNQSYSTNSENNNDDDNPIHDSDSNNDGEIQIEELNNYIQSWRTSSSISLGNLIEAIRIWKL